MNEKYYEQYDAAFDYFKVKIGRPKFVAYADGFCEFYNGEGSKLNTRDRNKYVVHCTDTNDVERILEIQSKVAQVKDDVKWYALYQNFDELYNSEPKIQRYLDTLGQLSKNFEGDVEQYLREGFECVEGELVQYRAVVRAKAFMSEQYT